MSPSQDCLSVKLMNTFLSKISKLDTVQDVILLSNQGEPLFFTPKSNTTENDNNSFSHWIEILSDLDWPPTIELIFNEGSYYICRTNIGYVIVGLTDDNMRAMIKQACATILAKLSAPTLCKRVLLNLLSTCGDTLKPNIIKELAPYADEEVAAVLIFLLHKQYDLPSGKKEQLQLLICQVLGYCSSRSAVKELNDYLTSRGAEKNIPGNEIFEAVRISIEQLSQSKAKNKELLPTHIPDNHWTTEQKTALANKKTTQPNKVSSVSKPSLPQEEQINAMLKKGEKEDALILITKLIAKCSQNKQFTTAYKLRDWLICINPMALTEIIQTAELIEAAKLAAIDKDHLQTWGKLADILSTEEFSSLYHAMTLKTFPKGKKIVQQGTNARTLIFINSGQVQTLLTKQNILIPLSIKKTGDIVGAGTFFEASVWTISTASLGCEVFILSRAKFEILKEHHSSLESKLFDFCSGFQATSAQLKKTKRNRREFKRRRISGRISFVVLNKSSKEVSNESKGSLIDISRGGLAFSIHSSQKKNAISLFARQIRVSINAGVASSVLIRTGTIQAVRDMDLIGNEYSLHLEFSKRLSNSELQQIIHCQDSKI